MQAASEPLVSVVLPTYNRTEYLKQAVESVSEQTYEHIELIVVDDHSPTPARDVLSNASFDRDLSIIQIRHEENKGANAARNTGIEAASGEFIAFIDDDDRWMGTKVEQQVERFREAGSDVGAVCTGARLVDHEDNDLNTHIPAIRGQVTRDVLAGNSPGTFSVLMVRSECIDAAGPPDERFPSWQDLEWCLRLSNHCKFESIPEPLMVRRTGHDGRISQDFEAKRDVSYPLFVLKHRELAAQYGSEYESLLAASLSRMLGLAALKSGYYADARRYLLTSIVERPFALPSDRYLQLLSTLGGKHTYLPSRWAMRRLRSIRVPVNPVSDFRRFVTTRTDGAVERTRGDSAAPDRSASNPDVAFFVPSLTVGGAQRATVGVANGLAERGYSVDLIVSYREGAFLNRVNDSVRIHSLDTPRVPVVGIGASAPALRSYLEERTPPVLFSAMTYANLVSIAAGAASNTGTKVVGIEHSTFGNRAGIKERLTLALATYSYELVDHVVAVSEGVAGSIVANTVLSEPDVSVLHNPVSIATVRAESRVSIEDSWLRADDLNVLLWAGRLEPEKDLLTLLEAFASVHRADPTTRLILAGTGSKREELESSVETLGIERAVSFPGYIGNPYPYMRQASAFVLSSRREGLPTVLIEALACGCPVVSTDCPSGPREILADGTYGTLVPVGDERALAEAIRSTLEDPPDPARLSERAEEFTTSAVLDQYVALIERVLE